MILDGKKVSEKIYEELKKEIGGLKAKGIRPFLAVILVGEAPASLLYVKKKEEKAETLGIGFKLYHFPAIVLEPDVLELIADLNCDPNIHGIIVQLPLPKNIDTNKILKSIDSQKDIERVSPAAQAILEILRFYNFIKISARSHNIDLKNKKIIIVGRGKLVGQPLEKILNEQHLNIEICDSETTDLKSKTLSADIIISGVGEPGLITLDMVSKKAIVIDAGTAESSGKLTGDVDPGVYQKVSAYSPVPGGVGPVTVACLYKNLIEAAKKLRRT